MTLAVSSAIACDARVVKLRILLDFYLFHFFKYSFLSLFQIIDPFVEVEIIGLPVDCYKEQTRVVDDNGKTMVWVLCLFYFPLAI